MYIHTQHSVTPACTTHTKLTTDMHAHIRMYTYTYILHTYYIHILTFNIVPTCITNSSTHALTYAPPPSQYAHTCKQTHSLWRAVWLYRQCQTLHLPTAGESLVKMGQRRQCQEENHKIPAQNHKTNTSTYVHTVKKPSGLRVPPKKYPESFSRN